MIFTSFSYLYFFAAVFVLYWAVPRRTVQNALLLVASYVFYGWIHPWFCILMFASTLIDYAGGLGVIRFPERKKLFLALSMVSNLGLLCFFKYFNFFSENVNRVLGSLGLALDPITLSVILPVGISFYTFQSMSYMIDVYRGELAPRRNFLEFFLFVSFFPQLVAGPIERAGHLLPQVETARVWDRRNWSEAWPLLVRGYLKKLVIADNVAAFVVKIFMLEHPPASMLLAGALAFAVQIYADFSAYTDIARGSARLLGFRLMENFRSPYLAISPSDFWRRWHISFSTWIKDYLYIPLGGSRVSGLWRFGLVVMVTMGLSGLWHGAAWNFVLWGLFHGALLFAYHAAGLGGRWQPRGALTTFVAWFAMFGFTLFGWLLFRMPSLGWLVGVFTHFSWGLTGDELTVFATVLAFVAFYSLPLFGMLVLDRVVAERPWVHSAAYAMAVALIVWFFQEAGPDFIYFQF